MGGRVPRTAVGIESSTEEVSVAALSAGVVREVLLSSGRRHASDLLPALDRLRRDLSAPEEIDAVIVGTGPGSYTGLRVGIATALGLVRATDARLCAVSSFEALAYAELEAGGEACVARNARAGRFYVASYRRTPDDVETIAAPLAVPADEAPSRLAECPSILCDLSTRDELGLAGAGSGIPGALRAGIFPRALAVLQLGLRRLELHGPSEPGEVRPLYLM